MDESVLLKIIIGLLTVIISIIGFNVRTHKGDHDKLKESHNDFTRDVLKNYATKADLNAARMETNGSLERIHERIDDLGENVDSKMNTVIGLLKQ